MLDEEITKITSKLSFTDCEKLADKKDSKGMFMLGYYYENGIEVEKDENKAFAQYEKSAELNNPYGMYKVGQCYLNGIGIEKDEHQAFTWYKKSANAGNSNGIYQVGHCYLNGIGVEKNELQAFTWYGKSANEGNSNGMYQVGVCYDLGIGVETDKQKAFEHYKSSAKAGNSKGFSRIIELSDEMGRVDGMIQVGDCYLNGIGVEKNEHQAFIWYKKSAEKGDSNGINYVGYCYEHGIGVEKDEKEVFAHFQKSVDKGDSDGMFQVGFCYYHGIGVKMDKQQAFKYYLKSAEMGNSIGIFKTAICYYYGIGVEKDKNEYYEWIEKDPILYDSIDDDGIDIGRYRNPEFGKCAHCNENNTKPAWCLTCDPDITAQGWTSRNKNIDNCIREFQLRAFKYEDAIEWIPFDRLSDINEIGKGGFGSVYSATWLDGIRKIDKNKRAREPTSIVALKTLADIKENNFDFLKEFKSHMTCKLNFSNLAIYGITRNTKTNEYLMVFQYADKGSLHKYLKNNFRELTWKNKLQLLKDISYELHRIHDNAKYIHADFHSGNILHDQRNNKNAQSYIADLGLSRKEDDENVSEDDIYGVMPYVAPEVLLGKGFTQAADIYGFGVIMAELSTGKRPFDGCDFDTKLAVRICNGERPEFATRTPDCYVELAKQCMHSDPQKRPKAWSGDNSVYKTINRWLKKIASSNKNEIKKQFLDADKIIKTLPIISPSHPDHMYTSKIISTRLISSVMKED